MQWTHLWVMVIVSTFPWPSTRGSRSRLVLPQLKKKLGTHFYNWVIWTTFWPDSNHRPSLWEASARISPPLGNPVAEVTLNTDLYSACLNIAFSIFKDEGTEESKSVRERECRNEWEEEKRQQQKNSATIIQLSFDYQSASRFQVLRWKYYRTEKQRELEIEVGKAIQTNTD